MAFESTDALHRQGRARARSVVCELSHACLPKRGRLSLLCEGRSVPGDGDACLFGVLVPLGVSAFLREGVLRSTLPTYSVSEPTTHLCRWMIVVEVVGLGSRPLLGAEVAITACSLRHLSVEGSQSLCRCR